MEEQQVKGLQTVVRFYPFPPKSYTQRTITLFHYFLPSRRSATLNKRLVAALSLDNQHSIIKTWSCKTVSGVVRKHYRPKVDWRPIYNSHYQPCDKGQGRCVVRFPKTNVHRLLAAKNGCADAALYKRQRSSRRESRHSRTRAKR